MTNERNNRWIFVACRESSCNPSSLLSGSRFVIIIDVCEEQKERLFGRITSRPLQRVIRISIAAKIKLISPLTLGIVWSKIICEKQFPTFLLIVASICFPRLRLMNAAYTSIDISLIER